MPNTPVAPSADARVYESLQWPAHTPLTAAEAQHLFEQAFGPLFTTDDGVTYHPFWGAWVARFAYRNIPVEVCFNAPDWWRVSHQVRVNSTTIGHDANPVVLRQRLHAALHWLATMEPSSTN